MMNPVEAVVQSTTLLPVWVSVACFVVAMAVHVWVEWVTRKVRG